MFATTGPSISADGLQATTDLSSPSMANQPQVLEAQSNQLKSSIAAAQSTSANQPLETRDRLTELNPAAPVGGGTTSSSNAPSPTPVPSATPVPDCEPSSGGLYCVYTVKAGDTLSAIAKRFGLTTSGDLSPAEMLAESNKPAVVESNSIETGLKLRIPSQSGILHTVFSNETISDLSSMYGVDAAAIEAANSSVGTALLVGQNVLVPNPEYIRLPSAPLTAAAPTETPPPTVDEEATAALAAEEGAAVAEEPDAAAAAAPEELETALTAEETPTAEPPTVVPPSPIPAASATAKPATATPRRGTATPTPKTGGGSTAGFIWPAQGPISSYYGPAHPLGIDIDFYADPTQPVGAAAAGTVTFAGGDACCSYGFYVIVDHGNGFQTLYAHFSKISVSAGQKVTQGQVLGNGGQTGYATGYHLHFEVHLNGAIVNPLTYLP